MITVSEVVIDHDMIAPQPFTIMRSMGQWTQGGFVSTTSSFSVIGPVQQANNQDITMLPEADRIGAIRSFWATVEIFVTRGKAAAPGTHGEPPAGSGTNWTISASPPAIMLTKSGLLLIPGKDYTMMGNVLTLGTAAAPGVLWAEWPVTVFTAPSAADIIVYEGDRFRILQVYRVPGSGYWKALGTRLSAA